MTTANEPLAADRAFLWNLERQSPGLHIAGLAANGNGGDDAAEEGQRQFKNTVDGSFAAVTTYLDRLAEGAPAEEPAGETEAPE